MKLTLTLDMGNAAFDGNDAPNELARIFRSLAISVENQYLIKPGDRWGLFDINGNRVGHAEVTP